MHQVKSMIRVCVLVAAVHGDEGVKINTNVDISLELDTGDTTEKEGQGRRWNRSVVVLVV